MSTQMSQGLKVLSRIYYGQHAGGDFRAALVAGKVSQRQ